MNVRDRLFSKSSTDAKLSKSESTTDNDSIATMRAIRSDYPDIFTRWHCHTSHETVLFSVRATFDTMRKAYEFVTDSRIQHLLEEKTGAFQDMSKNRGQSTLMTEIIITGQKAKQFLSLINSTENQPEQKHESKIANR